MNNLFEQTLEEVETLSDIPDNDLGVDDLSDDEPRLRLPNLKPIKKEKRKVSTSDEVYPECSVPYAYQVNVLWIQLSVVLVRLSHNKSFESFYSKKCILWGWETQAYDSLFIIEFTIQ